ncbi:MAG: hypothetical protein FJZ90_09140, partial [Chloroflexi bacterium]|nr:hypothetical protein [Chloroflexota bacterium]
GGPSVANDMDWYQVRDQANAEGWVADTYLSAAK